MLEIKNLHARVDDSQCDSRPPGDRAMMNLPEVTMLPGRLVAEFWAEVRNLLQNQHEFSEQAALQGIVEYRELMTSHRVGDMVYHRDPPAVAETIAGALRRGGFQHLLDQKS